MRVKLEKKLLNIGEFADLPDYSYNHYYNVVSDKQIEVLYLVPATEADAIKAMSPKSQKEIP